MSNQRFRSDFIDNYNTTNRRYRGKYGPKVRTKWDQRLPNDFNVSFNNSGSRDQNQRQIRFNTNRDDNNNNQSNRRPVRDGSERNDRSFSNWSRSTRGQRVGRQSRNQRRNAQAFSQQINDRNKDDIDSQWFKIIIPHGSKYEKQEILKLIQDSTQLTFTPYNFHVENGQAVFFVLGGDTADALRAISRKISAPNGYKIIVLVNRSAIPPTPIDEELTNTIKLVMSERYNVDNKVMDLSKFREDINLRQLGLYVPLSRPNMLNTVINIIIENTPEIIGVNLKDNKLTALEPLVKLANVCHSLKAIDLSQNQIRNATELDFIKGLELLELALDGNPFCESFEDQAAYIRSGYNLPKFRFL